ncbi:MULTISPECIES: triose-phosphate isomerase family protein [Actinosynnema]|uniref:triose-phosphate isomerase family protein n=1 Tax=Actinosynnema TaxID=40566 RepID=UPI0020A58262|nr:triose-phosphate isomerase family protein [Actinosynnema pretiosum]MCP2092343.1 triosephosphate isomerase [Actinosynnema pretiosum]
MPAPRPRVAIGVSLKMYLGPRRTREWFDEVLSLVAGHPALASGTAELFVLPTFTELSALVAAAGDTGIAVGAQDLSWEDQGAYTGEVSGVALREIGCRYVEVGHAERRRLFTEDDRIVAAKLAAALRNQLEPVLCVGEPVRGTVEHAVEVCRAQLASALVNSASLPGPITLAYEPVWAIGAAEPAPHEHVRAVCAALRGDVAGRPGSRVIYGGSAGPGLYSALGGDADGLFLGRFAHDPAALRRVLDEVAEVEGVPA